MAFLDMKAELAQAIPGMSRIYAGTLINRAWRVVRDATLWSFQLQIGSFSTPGLVHAGTVTTPILPTPSIIIGDATATAAWAAMTFPLITSYQFRVGDYSIYNIIGYDTVTYAPFTALTLDRPYVDPVKNGVYSGQAYQIFQAYYPAPSKTFKRWLSVQDMVNGYGLGIWTNRRDVNWADPMRQIGTTPVVISGMGNDARPLSATLGWPMFEMWPAPTSVVSYMTYYVDRGADLTSNQDALPEPITEDVVLTKARWYAYEWAEARKDVMASKGSGANYSVLMKGAEEAFLARLKTLRLLDKDNVDAFMSRMNGSAGFAVNPWYNAGTSRAGMGWMGGLY
jgi:hypothetical protein